MLATMHELIEHTGHYIPVLCCLSTIEFVCGTAAHILLQHVAATGVGTMQETISFQQTKRGEPIDKKHTLAMRCASINM